MKNFLILLLLLVLLMSNVFLEKVSGAEAVKGENIYLYPIADKGKYGYMTSEGVIVISPQFERAFHFSEGFAVVRINGKFGIIDSDGNWLVEPRYLNIKDFHEGFAAIENFEQKWGYINTNGDVSIECKYDYAENFNHGAARVGIQGFCNYMQEKFFDAPVKLKYFFINFNGEKTSEPLYDLKPIEIKDKWGYANSSGKIVIHAIYEKIRPFAEGVAAVKLNGLYGYIDSSGSFKIKPTYKYADSFSESFAVVSNYDQELYFYINTEGKKVFKKGFIEAYPFKGPLAKVRIDKEGMENYIDQNGKIVVPSYPDIKKREDSYY